MDRKRISRQVLLLVVACLLCGCTPTAEEAPTVEVEDMTLTDRNATADGRVRFLEYTRYSGDFVEDGSGDAVEDVAAILVQNTSGEYLQFSELVFHVGTQTLSFTVTGLPPGACCWVLEQDARQIQAGEVFYYVEDSSIYLPVSQVGDTLQAELGSGSLTVRNYSNTAVHDVQVYYKQIHEDGHLFGGITYACPVGSLEPGEEKALTAGHSDPGHTQIVRIERTKEDRS